MDRKGIEQSVDNISAELSAVSQQIQDLEKKIRIENRVGHDLKEELTQLTAKEDETKRHLNDLNREECESSLVQPVIH